MVERTDLTRASTMARIGSSRASVRSVSDKHLMQEIEKADVFHSETPSDFERFQMVGLTSVPMKQKEDDKQKSQNKQGGDKSDESAMNHDQPKGESAEAVMLYLNGQRSHPIGMIDDRRVRPYNMKEGETALYAASGTGQMVVHTDDGTYIVSLDNKGYDSKSSESGAGGASSKSSKAGESSEEQKERVVSIRHVKKEKQSREIKEGEEPEDHVHEGKADQVNTEIRCSGKKIEILDAEDVIAVYNKEEKSWTFSNFKKLTLEPDEEFNITTKAVNIQATDSMKVQCQAEFELDGHPLKVNGGGPTIPPFTVP